MKKYLVYLQNTALQKEHNHSKFSDSTSEVRMIYVETDSNSSCAEDLAYEHLGDRYQDWYVIKVESLND